MCFECETAFTLAEDRSACTTNTCENIDGCDSCVYVSGVEKCFKC